MNDPAALGAFLVAAVAASLFWGGILGYLDERSPTLRWWMFLAMSFTRRGSGEVRAWILSGIYYAVGVLGTLLFATAFRLPLTAHFALPLHFLALTVLGIVGEISLTSLLVGLGCAGTRWGRPDQFAEVREIPWMKGLAELPPRAVPVAAALAGVVEELFFRGVMVLILTERLRIGPLVGVVIAGVLFSLEQLVQVRTAFQALVIGSGCMAISLVGGLLVVHTGSVLPAILCHGSFVLFFMGRAGSPRA